MLVTDNHDLFLLIEKCNYCCFLLIFFGAVTGEALNELEISS